MKKDICTMRRGHHACMSSAIHSITTTMKIPKGDEPIIIKAAKAKAKKTSSNKWFFPSKLYALLDDPRNYEIIRWMDHGRSWKIVDRKGLNGVLQKYFKHESENGKSFIRSVNCWGFKV